MAGSNTGLFDLVLIYVMTERKDERKEKSIIKQ